MRPFALLLAGSFVLACSSSKSEAPAEDPCAGISGTCVGFVAGRDDERKIQTAFATAAPGTTLAFGAGTFPFTNSLALATERITVVGKGLDKTFLDFSGQLAGSEALSITKGSFVIQDLAVRDAKGDAIKVEGADGVTFRRVRAEWSRGAAKGNGAYGLYPVSCKNVLIEGCQSYGASDAGIYIGQSEKIIVRQSLADSNVAGIEIENSHDADVTQNEAKNNTAGILVFDLPGLPSKNGGGVRVFGNNVHDNNTHNFAATGSIVGKVPAGTGVLVMANHDVEVFQNTLTANGTVGIGVVSYYIAQDDGFDKRDPAYYPYPQLVYVHDNASVNTGTAPDVTNLIGNTLKISIKTFPGEHVPDVVYDGIVDDKRASTGLSKNTMDLCVRLPSGGTFANLKAASGGPGVGFPDMTTDVTPFACDLKALPGVTTNGAGR